MVQLLLFPDMYDYSDINSGINWIAPDQWDDEE